MAVGLERPARRAADRPRAAADRPRDLRPPTYPVLDGAASIPLPDEHEGGRRLRRIDAPPDGGRLRRPDGGWPHPQRASRSASCRSPRPRPSGSSWRSWCSSSRAGPIGRSRNGAGGSSPDERYGFASPIWEHRARPSWRRARSVPRKALKGNRNPGGRIGAERVPPHALTGTSCRSSATSNDASVDSSKSVLQGLPQRRATRRDREADHARDGGRSERRRLGGLGPNHFELSLSPEDATRYEQAEDRSPPNCAGSSASRPPSTAGDSSGRPRCPSWSTRS